MAGVYRNTGAPWTRADGTVIERGAEFTPTDEERLRKAYKLELIGPAEPTNASVPKDELADFYQGGGCYMIGGETVRGSEAALAALEALRDEEDRQREAYRLDGP